ncbi:MAG: hypothetical protein JZU55_00325, partial [Afipia sp.]|nr:hypothetical protein [Afipia sp.]
MRLSIGDEPETPGDTRNNRRTGRRYAGEADRFTNRCIRKQPRPRTGNRRTDRGNNRRNDRIRRHRDPGNRSCLVSDGRQHQAAHTSNQQLDRQDEHGCRTDQHR